MTVTTYNNAPYFDDYNTPDSDGLTPFTKNYHRILFQPAYAVQTRELNQLQSMLQDQIRLGSEKKEGSLVVGGQPGTNLNDNIPYVDLTLTNQDVINGVSNIKFIETRDESDNPILSAEILYIELRTEGASEFYRAWLRYVKSDTNEPQKNRFLTDDVVYLKSDIIPNPEGDVTITGEDTSIGTVFEGETLDIYGKPTKVKYGFHIICGEGVYFIKGCYVHTFQQEYYFVKSTLQETVDSEVVFIINETTTNFEQDETLLDNANGTYNYAAPGADRYTIGLTLALNTQDPQILSLNSAEDGRIFNSETQTDIDYVRLITTVESQRQTVPVVEYASLDPKLARRTFEESGSYTVDPFLLNVREFLNENGNNGAYTINQMLLNNYHDLIDLFNSTVETEEEQITTDGISYDDLVASGGSNKITALSEFLRGYLVCELEKSVAYVEGFRIAPDTKRSFPLRKARGEDHEEKGIQEYVSLPRGNYIDVVYDPSVKTGNPSFAWFDNSSPYGKTIRAVEYLGVITPNDPEYYADPQGGTTPSANARDNWLKFRFYVFNNFDNLSGTSALPGGFDYRYLPGTINSDQPEPDSTIKNTSQNSSVFPLPYRAVTHIDNLSYQKYVTETVTGSGTYTIPAPANTTFPALNPLSIIIYDTTDDFILDSTSVITNIDQSSTDAVILTLNVSPTEITVVVPIDVEIIDEGPGNPTKNTDLRKTKTFSTATNVEVDQFDEDTGIGVINKYDVDISSIVCTTSGVSFTVVNTGRNANFYDYTILKFTGYTSGTPCVSYNYFTHGNLTGDVYTVDSYYESNGTTKLSTESFDKFPDYEQGKGSDLIDFRLRRTYDLTTGAYTLLDAPTVVDPNSIANVTFDHYKARKDNILVTTEGLFFADEGTPANKPTVPSTKDKSLKLYDITLRPYTYDAQDIITNYVNNNRYTMSDIARLDRRIKNLEYYTSLSLLEKEAKDKQILDLSEENAGAERFKNGILVDSFIGHNVGDVTNPDYSCAVDTLDRSMNSRFTPRNYRLKYYAYEDDGEVTLNSWAAVKDLPNARSDGRLGLEKISLDVGNREVLEESLDASKTESIQPYMVSVWKGELKLSPSNDEWVETVQEEAFNVNLSPITDSIKDIAQFAIDVFGTQEDFLNSQVVNRNTNTSTVTGRNDDPNDNNLQRTTTTTTTTTNFVDSFLVTSAQLEESISQIDFGNRLTDVSVIPWIRSRDIQFSAKGMKPNTKLYAFFDGQEVTDYCEQTSELVPFSYSNDVTSYTGQDAPTGGSWGTLVTDANGNITGRFRIPNNTEYKFNTGVRDFELSDTINNNKIESDTFALTTYSAGGVRQTVQGVVSDVPVFDLGITTVVEQRNRSVTTVDQNSFTFDPVAQTFSIGNEHPNGVFLTDIDLWFATKPEEDDIPCHIYIVPCENGIPTNTILPGSKVTKLSSEITNITGRPGETEDFLFPTDFTTNYATNFEFDHPVYLQPDQEYAVIVFGLSPEFRIWTSALTETNLVNNTPVIDNPVFGVFLKSENKKTWTPDQYRNMTIRLNKAFYATNTVQEFYFSTLIDGDTPEDTPNTQSLDDHRLAELTAIFNQLEVPGTNIDYEIDFFNSTNGAVTAQGLTGLIENRSPYRLSSEIVGQNLSGGNAYSAKVTARFSTTNRDVTPVISTAGSTLFAKEYLINDPEILAEGKIYELTPDEYVGGYSNDIYEFYGPEVAFGGNALSKYITRKVVLNNPSTEIRVNLAVNRPDPAANIRVFAKRKPTDQTDVSFETDVYWYEMQMYSVDGKPNVKDIPVNSQRNYAEVEYILPFPDPNFRDDIQEFTEFAIKIVFLSDDTAKFPKIKNLTAIASI